MVLGKVYSKHPFFRIIWWGVFTILVDISAFKALYYDEITGMKIVVATAMTIGWAYIITAYKFDGPNTMKSNFPDERAQELASKAKGISFWFFFLSTWILAFLINIPSLVFLKENINVLLASISMSGLLLYLVTFTLLKYKI